MSLFKQARLLSTSFVCSENFWNHLHSAHFIMAGHTAACKGPEALQGIWNKYLLSTVDDWMSGSFFNGVQMWIINIEGTKTKCHVVSKCIKYIFSAATFKNAFGIDVKGCLYSASPGPAMWETTWWCIMSNSSSVNCCHLHMLTRMWE